VRRFTPLLADAARFGRHRVGDRWHVDETYVKVAGRWMYLYRAVDQFGQVIDVYASTRRESAAARTFFHRARRTTGVTPAEVLTDRAPTYPGALDELWPAPGTTASSTRTTASTPTILSSNGGLGRCAASRP
jgi:transposase-like protein